MLMGDLCRASGQGRTLWGGLVGGVGAGRWSEGCGDGVGARREHAVLCCLCCAGCSSAAFRATKGKENVTVA